MEQLLKISRFIDGFNQRIGKWSSWLVLVMIIIGTWNVVGRRLGQMIGTNLSSNAYIEAQWYLFDLIFFLGAAYVLNNNGHVRVDIFYSKFNRRQKAIADLLGTILFLLPFCIWTIVFSWDGIVTSWQILEQSPDPNGLPRYPIKSLIIVGFSLLILQGISQAIKSVAILTGRIEPQEAQNGN